MAITLDDTIAAVASAPGGSPRGIVRVSGPAARACLAACFLPDHGEILDAPPQARRLAGRFIFTPGDWSLEASLLWWSGRRSYTRQPTGELHLLGSPPLLDAALETLVAHGARLARPGEFTLRAFLAGRLDLTQAEAVLGVIDARGEDELRVALGQLAGGLTRPLAELRGQGLDLLARLEAGLDFTEEDIEFITSDELDQELARLEEPLRELERRVALQSSSDERPRAVLVGPPNAGKSTLFNALIGRSSALVSAQAGTTRDYLEADVEWDGLRLRLVDLAGLVDPGEDDTGDALEQHIQAATLDELSRAALWLVCRRVDLPGWSGVESQRSTSAESVLRVATQADRGPVRERVDYVTSARDGTGIDELRRGIVERLAVKRSPIVVATALRARASLQQAAEGVGTARKLIAARSGEELVAAELRWALESLGEVAGVVYTDDLLDRIFSRFCIGK